MSTVCRRCVQFPRLCVQFSPECVHFSGKCVQSASECVQSGLTTPSLRRPQRGGFWAVLRWRLDGGSQPAGGRRWLWRRATTREQGVFTGLAAKCSVFARMCSLFGPMCSVSAPFRPDVFTFRGDVFNLDWRRVRFVVTTQGGRAATIERGAAPPEVFGIEYRRCFPEFTLTKAGEDENRDCVLLKEPFSRPGKIREQRACASWASAGLTLSSEPLGSSVISGRLVAARGGVNAKEP